MADLIATMLFVMPQKLARENTSLRIHASQTLKLNQNSQSSFCPWAFTQTPSVHTFNIKIGE
jgi:hypothetical protein